MHITSGFHALHQPSAVTGHTMRDAILVALGGALGALGRWGLSGLILHRTASEKLPIGTLAVNLLGCLVAGLLAGMAARHDTFRPATRLFLFTGLLGGFTTFSAFSLETVALVRRGAYAAAAGYVTLSVAGGLAAFALGMALIGQARPDRP